MWNTKIDTAVVSRHVKLGQIQKVQKYLKILHTYKVSGRRPHQDLLANNEVWLPWLSCESIYNQARWNQNAVKREYNVFHIQLLTRKKLKMH